MLMRAALESSCSLQPSFPDDVVLDLGAAWVTRAPFCRSSRRVLALRRGFGGSPPPRKKNLRVWATVNTEVVRGPLAQGWPKAAPYDVIVVNGGIEVEPAGLVKQLKNGAGL